MYYSEIFSCHIDCQVFIFFYVHLSFLCFPNRYLRERKEAQQKEQKAKAEASYIEGCPEGYVSLPDHERKETLRLLKKSMYIINKNLMVTVIILSEGTNF